MPLLPYLEQNPVYQNYTQYLTGVLSGSPNTNQLGAFGQSQVYMANLVCPVTRPLARREQLHWPMSSMVARSIRAVRR